MLLILSLAYMRFEAGFVKVERVKFVKDANCLKIVHLSDVHINLLKVPQETIRKIIRLENPDLIILTGDYIQEARDVEKFLPFLKGIANDNTYLCFGNHDYSAFSEDKKGLADFIQAIRDMGIGVLHNSSVCFKKSSKKYNIIGIDDLRMGSPDVDKALENLQTDAFTNIAFSHNPDIVFHIPKNKVDYLFCGHFHGEQIWTPFHVEFMMLRDDKLCKMGIKSGLHQVNGINLYISRGLGNVCLPLRFLSRPEITVYHLP